MGWVSASVNIQRKNKNKHTEIRIRFYSAKSDLPQQPRLAIDEDTMFVFERILMEITGYVLLGSYSM